MSKDPEGTPTKAAPVIAYRRRPPAPPAKQPSTLGDVILGLGIGLATVVVGYPMFLELTHPLLPPWAWPTLARTVFAAPVAAMMLGAISIRRTFPGLLLGLSAGIAGGVFVLGVVTLYVRH
jgi:hypothetical protein